MAKVLWLIITFLLISMGALAGCSETNGHMATGWGQKGNEPTIVASHRHGHGPPPHAPAWGYRAKHQYRYYPDAFVYFDVTRKVYFYLEGPNWHMAVTLPSYYSGKLRGYVLIEMATDTPYLQFERHRKDYPHYRNL